MLTIAVGRQEQFDDEKQEFFWTDGVTIQLEHSLVTLSKWESFYEKPFLDPRRTHTDEETLKYVELMVVSPNPPENLMQIVTARELEEIQAYISAKMTATWFRDVAPKKPTREIITAELVYYWMLQANIPFECEHWHLNRLFTLIRVCSEKNSPPKKMSRADAIAQQKLLNEQRMAKYNTTG